MDPAEVPCHVDHLADQIGTSGNDLYGHAGGAIAVLRELWRSCRLQIQKQEVVFLLDDRVAFARSLFQTLAALHSHNVAQRIADQAGSLYAAEQTAAE